MYLGKLDKLKGIQIRREDIKLSQFSNDIILHIRHDTKSTSDKRKNLDKLDFIKMENFCAANEAIRKVKRQPTEWEKILRNIYLVRDLYPE